MPVRSFVAQTITTSFPQANANPNSNQTFGLSVVISAKHTWASRMPRSMASIGTDTAGS